jgi:hypothetical protein
MDTTEAAKLLGRKGGQSTSPAKVAAVKENGKLGGCNARLYRAQERINEMKFTPSEMEFIWADWDNMRDHIDWLLEAPREEIQSWIEAGK